MRKHRRFYVVLLTDRRRIGGTMRGLGSGELGHLKAVDHEQKLLVWTSKRRAIAAGQRYCRRWHRWLPTVVKLSADEMCAGLHRALVAAYGSSPRRGDGGE